MKDKTIVFGVTSSIACFKALDIIKRLKKNNIDVIPVLTKNTLNLISAKEFEAASGNKAAVELFRKGMKYNDYLNDNKKVRHISLADKADLLLVAPATANFIGKISNGIADDLLTTTVIATKSKVVLCPAMSSNMWSNPIVQGNIRKLKKIGYIFIEPEEGRLACGSGKGRLANTIRISDYVVSLVNKKDDLKGKIIIVTAGPTEEEIDAVRVITNKSSGKMGYAIAEAAKSRGAEVTLISGPTKLDTFVHKIDVKSVSEMEKEVMKRFHKADVFISAAAVSDFKVVKNKGKIKKNKDFNLKLKKNVDILERAGKKKKKQVLVGFALETSNIIKNALDKMKRKNLDMIIANDEKTLGADRSDFIFIDKKGMQKFKDFPKKEIADKILDKIKELL